MIGGRESEKLEAFFLHYSDHYPLSSPRKLVAHPFLCVCFPLSLSFAPKQYHATLRNLVRSCWRPPARFLPCSRAGTRTQTVSAR